MILPIPPNMVAAGVKSAGSIASAAIGRYRPAGVPRTGSSEDRAAAYQQLMDAIVHTHSTIYLFRHLQSELGERRAERVLTPHLSRAWDASDALLCGLSAVRLRGTAEVIATAEAVVTAVSDLNLNEADDEAFGKRFDVVVAAQNAFLEAARTDLGYDARPWQLLRKRREREFLRAKQQQAIEP